MNPLINMIASQANNTNPAMQMLSRFAEFKKQWTPQQAQAKINEMIQSGQVTQAQVEQARQMAEKFKGILK